MEEAKVKIEQAKAKRTTAKAQFTRVENALHKLMLDPQSPQESIERKSQELRDKWQVIFQEILT